MFGPSAGVEALGPYQHQPNIYPFAHIHPPQTMTAPTQLSQSARRPPPATARKREEAHPTAVRVSAAPLPTGRQSTGPSPSARSDHRRLDFSRPRSSVGRPLSQLDERAQRDAGLVEMPPEDAIRLLNRQAQQGAHTARSSRIGGVPTRVLSENNDPLSFHATVSLEKFERPDDGYPSQVPVQAQVSASYITQQTAIRMASKAEHLEQYHRSVQERLNKRVQQQKQEERMRRAALPMKVKQLVYDMDTPHADSPASESQEVVPHSQRGADGLARMDIFPCHEVAVSGDMTLAARQHAVPPCGDAYPHAQSSHPKHARRDGRLSLMTDKEAAAYQLQVRKEEMERERAEAQKARAQLEASGRSSSGLLSSRGRTRDRVAFGASLSRTPSPAATGPPLPVPRGPIGAADARDSVHRNPRSFVVQQLTEAEEAEQGLASDEQTVLHLTQSSKSRMSAAVAGRKAPRKKKEQGADGAQSNGVGTTPSSQHSAYRRHVLERLHTLSLTLNHPLPPLCACGFTPLDEYALLFRYQGTAPSTGPGAPTQRSHADPLQPPFNLSTLLAAQPSASSIHHPSAAHASAASSTRTSSSDPRAALQALPSHVALDPSRHAFQHKHNCQYYANADSYLKAMAALLHTMEDQQQI